MEEELQVQLDPDLPDLLAKVDLVTQADGCLHVVDFKTSRSRWNQQKAEESGEQLLLYGVTVAGMSRHLGTAVKLHFAIITKAKNPVVRLRCYAFCWFHASPASARRERHARQRSGNHDAHGKTPTWPCLSGP